MRRVPAAVLVALLLALGLTALPVEAGSTAKVVVVVGPVGDHNAHYKSDARDIAAEARKHTSNVVTLFTPNATWPAVKAAAQGASVFVYLGHGNGWPSIYPPFQTVTKDGLGLDPQSGADGDKHVYYGEDYIRNNIRLAPNAVVLLYHLCYASGNTEPGLSQGTFAEARRAGRQLRRRVHRRGRAGGDRGGPPRPSGDQRDPPAVHDQPHASTRSSATRRPGTATSRGRSRRSARPVSDTRWTPTRRRRPASTARSSATSGSGRPR